MSQLNDISLIAQVVMFHNNRAFDQLVRKYQSPVRRFFLNLTCGDSELSDDLAQDTFIRAYTSLASFKNLSSFSTWLYRIAYNQYYDYLRSRKETVGPAPRTGHAERHRANLHHPVLPGGPEHRQDSEHYRMPYGNRKKPPFEGQGKDGDVLKTEWI